MCTPSRLQTCRADLFSLQLPEVLRQHGFQNCATPRILSQWFGGQANKGILGVAVPTYLTSIRLEKGELIYALGSAIRMSKYYWTLIWKWAAGIFHLGDQHGRKEPSGGDQLNSSYPRILKAT